MNATDYNIGKKAVDLMPKVELEDFVLDISESGSFNLSLFFGNCLTIVDDKQGDDSACFVTSLELIAKPERDIIQDIYNKNNSAKLPDDYEVVNGTVQLKNSAV